MSAEENEHEMTNIDLAEESGRVIAKIRREQQMRRARNIGNAIGLAISRLLKLSAFCIVVWLLWRIGNKP